MNDKIKYFLYGWLMGVKQLEREKAPVEKPVQFINIGYEKDKMKVGEKQILTATLYPPDATYQAVEWQSSDIDVLAVNKLTETSAEISALKTGDAQIVCRATDTFGAKAAVIFHVQGNSVFTSFTFSGMSNFVLDPRVAAALVCVDYEPKTMKGTDWGIELHNSVSGGYSPYTIEDSIFDNCKLIKPNYTSNNFDDYISSSIGLGKQLFDIKTKDGSGIQILNKRMEGVNKGEFTNALFGYSGTLNRNLTILAGYECQIYSGDGLSRIIQAIDIKDIGIEVEQADEIISVYNFTVTGLKAGIAKIKINMPNEIDSFEVNVTVVDTSTSTTEPNLCMVDNSGAAVYDSALIIEENSYKVGFYGETAIGGKVISIKSKDTNKLEVNSDMTVTALKPGFCAIDLTYEYGGAHTQSTITYGIQIYSEHLVIHKVESPYLKDGICLCVTTDNNAAYSDDYNMQNIVSLFNSNQVELVDKFKIDSRYTIPGCTYKPMMLSMFGTATYFKFRKLVSYDVPVLFQIGEFTETKESITI